MTIISIIAAVDEKNGLGRGNQLIWHLPADLAHFKSITIGKPIIMGRNTYDSIGKALPGRTNIVLSKKSTSIKGVEIFESIPKALAFLAKEPEVMIIGGAKIYEQALPIASRLYLTVVHHKFDADVFFPNFDKSLWQCTEEVYRPRDEKNCYDMTFFYYERIPNSKTKSL